MNRDPGDVNKDLKILVRLMAELINDFFEPLSYKTITFLGIGFTIVFWLSEFIFKKNTQTIQIKDLGN